MRKIAASYIFPVISEPVKNGILILDDNNNVIGIDQFGEKISEKEGIEFYSGFLVPGFINTHCHIELSYLKGYIPENQKLQGFISSLNQLKNNFSAEEKEKRISMADRVMFNNGISAVGDISNNTGTIETKLSSKIYYHTFVEIYGSDGKIADRAFRNGLNVLNYFKKENLSASLVPHSPYSVSDKLFKMLGDYYKQHTELVSMHNQESGFENELFRLKSEYSVKVVQSMGGTAEELIPTGKNSLESIFHEIENSLKIILVHNTCTNEEDIEFIKSKKSDVYLSICPDSNLYIENRLPEIGMFYKKGLKLTIGTDSLASNRKLCILSEMRTLQHHFPEIPFSDLLLWATLNGAEALNVSRRFGSFETGKNPGVVLIEKVDYKRMKLMPDSECRRLV